MKYTNALEEEIKNKVSQDFFKAFDCTKILGKIDFAVKAKQSVRAMRAGEADIYFLWAEAKQKPADVLIMLTQLVLTIGKARTFNEVPPPMFLGCYDNTKIAFVPYPDIQGIFYRNDFNWKVTPSNTETREFKQVYARIQQIIENDKPGGTFLFDFEKDNKELRQFIQDNFTAGKTETAKIRIEKNNFIRIYSKWIEKVKPTILVPWDTAKKSGIIDSDFYLADLLSADNKTLKQKLFVLLETDRYRLNKHKSESGLFATDEAFFSDRQRAHSEFWAIYERPPLEVYWDYIIERRDLLVPQDVRERKGSFFTPKIWVELSQKYLADVLGVDWQDEYYIWDCAAGTGNLLDGLINKHNIFASTLDQADVDVMLDRVKNGANLAEENVFRFDFLNDDFTKLPKSLQAIINSEEKRKKLVVYINPPYAEVATTRTRTNTGMNKNSVEQTATHSRYSDIVGIAMKELSAQFFARIYGEIPGCILAEFSTLKIMQGPNFSKFRQFFQAKLQKGFIVPANTFDNVTGKFPICFFIWDTSRKEIFKNGAVDIFDKDGCCMGIQKLFSYDNMKLINDWIIETRNRNEGHENIAFLGCYGTDFSNQNIIRIMRTKEEFGEPRGTYITQNNLLESCIYLAVRHVIPADWLNDRDQFLYPAESWQTDKEFQNDCLTCTLFHSQNKIQSAHGVNHWIPFTEKEVYAKGKFESNFMTEYISGKLGGAKSANPHLFEQAVYIPQEKLIFSPEALAVFDAGRELWRYYHAQPGCDLNAGYYDIRERFQGRELSGNMCASSKDEKYTELIGNLRNALKAQAAKIEPKIYEHGFLRK
ncbi:MAG: hypothetical protein LBC99_04995 [Spirochaetota bacterium]|jgi:hypothetical protein|nr:hypothetical protein [Spirochaetota bacterium]